jgi:hypothetical protein
VSAPTVDRLEPNLDRQPRQRFDIRPHGTEARAKRERREGRKPCTQCRAAERAAHDWRAAQRRAAAEVASNGT